MQKLVYVSNSRDYTEQGDINENKYFRQINKLLDEGWAIAHVLPNVIPFELTNEKNEHKESVAAFVVLEKPDEEKIVNN